MQRLAVVGIALALDGCASQPVQPIGYEAPIPSKDALYQPQRVQPGRLEYSPDRDTFAQILTRRGPYPTQQQANYAYQRALGAPTYAPAVVTKPVRTKRGVRSAKRHEPVIGTPDPYVIPAPAIAGDAALQTKPASIRLFACKPGGLDSQTARVTVYNGPVIHCATDFLNAAGGRMYRETINFYYYRDAWHVDFTNPPRKLVPWLNRSSSPRDPWSWVPGRDRYK